MESPIVDKNTQTEPLKYRVGEKIKKIEMVFNF